MRMPPRSLQRNRCGFTLVEVTLAIAVALIGIVGVLAILPQGMQSARSAADNTITATIVENLFSQLRAGSFNNIVICPDTNNCNSPVKIDLTQTQNAPALFFDQTGSIVNTNNSNNNNIYYRVNLTWQPQNLNQPQQLSEVTATVYWPAFSPHPANTNIYTTAIAWYDNP